jgi:hypothetical protein
MIWDDTDDTVTRTSDPIVKLLVMYWFRVTPKESKRLGCGHAKVSYSF